MRIGSKKPRTGRGSNLNLLQFLEFLFKTGLLEYFIRCVARFAAMINREVSTANWAMPDRMIAFTLSVKFTPCIFKGLDHLTVKAISQLTSSLKCHSRLAA